jgi:DNA-binding winged helix-turn-helix (wHTH) protein/TolB-like protein
MDIARAPHFYHFNGFTVDPVKRKVYDPDNNPLQLSSRAFDTLLTLIENRGQVISRRDLIETVWPKVVVEENNLNQAISALRKALNDPKKTSRIILNVPGRGYCFIAELEDPEQSASNRMHIEAVTLRQAMPMLFRQVNLVHFYYALLAVTLITATVLFFQVKAEGETADILAHQIADNYATSEYSPLNTSIAIKPFDYLGEVSSEHHTFSQGLYDHLVEQLTNVHGVNLINNYAVLQADREFQTLKAFGRELQAESVLTGNLQFVGDRVRVSMQLVNPETGITLWSETLEADISPTGQDVILQEMLALNIADSLLIKYSEPIQTALVSNY